MIIIDITLIKQKLQKTFLFQNAGEDSCDFALKSKKCTVLNFVSGEVIYSQSKFRRSLGFLLEGSALVRKPGERHSVIMRRLEQGMSFGAAALYNQSEVYVTEITAETSCMVLFLDEELMTRLMKKDFVISQNYIRFLSSRITFLNGLIDSYSTQGSENKLIRFLLSNLESPCDSEVSLLYNMSQLSEALGIGRASLYRVFDRLEQEGMIERSNRKIKIIDRGKLERMV